ncbi:transketolase [Salipaludibacillus keqinensis]|uniref:Transketolase n=1 Tax=Salipaludibacillus keqinensis TaxID=2045207 RepID=A0A323TT77_9BACI|nr:transketolase C-terminal domain-containing protein [Salipaludibacillus keqinensis]PYZ92655.1 transketolase [Salipaludibacillus keqinensis]
MTVSTKSMRDVFGEELAKLSLEDKRVVALDGDLGNSTRLSFVEKANPSSFLQMGIAEQNLVGVAAGLATCGMIPWACSFTAFITRRAFDQLVVSVDQPKLNVKLVGSYSGLLTSNTGKTHHSFEDIALMTSLPNMIVLSPGDAKEVQRIMRAMNNYHGPAYLRLSRDEGLDFLDDTDEEFIIGKAKWLKRGKNDVACLSTGAMSPRVKIALARLEAEGISITHVHFPTLKPLDEKAIIELASSYKHLITVEEHYVRHGFGSLINEVTSSVQPVKTTRIGIQNEYSECGGNEELLAKHGLSPEKLEIKIREIVEGD